MSELSVSAVSVIDHIAFVVPSVDEAVGALDSLGLQAQPVQSFPSEGTRECYLGAPSDTGRLLLIEAVEDGPYKEAFERRGAGLHHVALAVEDHDVFLAEQVDGSGWLVHPRSFATRSTAGTIWLARPGVETLVECMEVECMEVGCMESERDENESSECQTSSGGDSVVEQVVIAGLDIREGLVEIFDCASLEVVSGPRSGVVVGGRFVSPHTWGRSS